MANCISWVGIDDHADKWTICHLEGQKQKPSREWELMPGESGYRKLIGWLRSLPGEVRVVYEAGPCGYEMQRRLTKGEIRCEVAAPSLTPTKPGDKVKTNRRDALKLARLYRAGELTLIVIPGPRQEAARDLVRARQSVSRDVMRARHQLSKLLLRYGHRYRDGRAWTQRHWKWIKAIQLTEDLSQHVVDELILTIEGRLDQLARYNARIEELAKSDEYQPMVGALAVLRGVSTLTAMTILVELGDLRRFATAPQLMQALGLVPSEFSTGNNTKRYGITKTGNAHVRHVLVEAAWQYSRRPTKGAKIKARRKEKPPQIVAIAEKCDVRLHRRFHRLTSRGKLATVAVVAVARELAGFIWAIGQEHTA